MEPFGLLIVSGGEPFVRRDLAEVVTAFVDGCGVPRVSVPTNGSYPIRARDFVETVLEETPLASLCISLSIDGVGADHDELRALPGSYEKILETAAVLAPLRARYRERFVLHTASVFSALNQHRMSELIATIKRDVGPDTMGLTLVREPFRGPHHEGLDVDLYRKLNRELAGWSISRRYTRFGARLHRAKAERVAREQVDNEYISPCYAGHHSAVIYADGTVPLCEKRDELLGSVRDFDYDFAALWRSRQARSAARRQVDERCRCGHECYVTPNIVLNPRQLARAMLGR